MIDSAVNKENDEDALRYYVMNVDIYDITLEEHQKIMANCTIDNEVFNAIEER